MSNSPAKAVIEIEWPDKRELIPVQYNPTELSFSKSVQLAEIGIPGIDSPLQQFVRGQAEKLTLELFFDTTDEGMGLNAKSVTLLTDRFYQLVKIDSRTHAPPICSFIWNRHDFPGAGREGMGGGFFGQQRSQFRGIAESITQKFTLFSPTGVPLRATLSLVLREYKTLSEQLTQLNLKSPDHTKTYVIKAGDTLPEISAATQGNAADWKRIADHNRIRDPLRLSAGQILEIPPI
jgi:nucleoid-associated protein YgaU